jgi:pimeloyl-ACP methyl ester carboxylesterase
VSGLVAISPPGWRVLQEPFPIERSRRLWRWLFQGPIGNLFYRYARRRGFLLAFSRKNLFADADTVDEEWLETLRQGSRAMETRWAVYSFLAGFWRRDWEPQLTQLRLPLLVVFGRSATGIGRSRDWDDLDQRLSTYRLKLPAAAIETIPGRNVLPYESTEACVQCVSTWLNAHGS